jgi:hypothetical protein
MGILDGFTFKKALPVGTISLAHWMCWFGTSGHRDVGYKSADLTKISQQVDRMVGLEIDGVNVDWYGPDHKEGYTNLATQRLLAEVERKNMLFSLCMDGGITKDKPNPQQLIEDAILYAKRTYITSPNYIRHINRPVITFFGAFAGVDFTKVRQIVPDAAFLFQNKGAFTQPQADGGFAWVIPKTNQYDPNLTYLTEFYDEAAKYPQKLTMGVVYPGFYDPHPKDATKSVWDLTKPVRVMSRRGGLTILDTCSVVPAGVPFVQVCTFNDIEEGSHIEEGLD